MCLEEKGWGGAVHVFMGMTGQERLRGKWRNDILVGK